MNEENDMALNQTAEETSPTTTPVEETKAPEEVAEAPVESTETAKEQAPETGRESKKGFTHRVQELANENKSLKQRLAELTGGTQEQSFDLPQTYVPQVAPGQEVSPEQYQQDVIRRADALVNLRIKQSEAINRINNESSEAMRLHPELDPDSDKFNKDLSESVTEAVEAYVRSNPYTASPLKFVEKLMKPYKGAVAKEVGQAQENLAKQMSQSALKPTSVSKQEKSPEEMSIKELEAKLGVVQA